MGLIYYIEDDLEQYQFWAEQIEELGFETHWFETPYDAWRAAGNPDAIILDVGSIGLMNNVHCFVGSVYQLRDKFPGSPIFLVSGIPSLPAEIIHELDEDTELVYPVGSYNDLGTAIQARL